MCDAYTYFDEDLKNNRCTQDGEPYCHYHQKVADRLLSPYEGHDVFPSCNEVRDNRRGKVLWKRSGNV